MENISLAGPEKLAGRRFNDGKVGPDGRFWTFLCRCGAKGTPSLRFRLR
ncbi:MAG: SMP-30/gluconolactonase/LRE family protein [Clostridia bacterium]|nr:SMP-30/gluconolactonase/LRE family protein [Clostridia bacterium]